MKNKTKKKFIIMFRYIMIAFFVCSIIGTVFSSKAYAAFDFASLASNGLLAGLSVAFGGWPLLIVNAIKLIIIIIGFVLQTLMSGFYSSLEGNLDWITLKDIIFAGTGNASTFLDVNFFNKVNQTDTIGQFSQSIAQWYYALRTISAAVLLVILIYVGIRMALSNVGQEQAKYKKMFIDWVVSVALLFLLHYIVIFIIQVNSSLVSAVAGTSNVDPLKTMMNSLEGMFWWIGVEGVFAAVIYLIMIGQIFSFFFLYVKRLITVGFLIMISPLICITYSIDKMGDGKAQALNNWLREITYNILIQTFHCVIYMAFFTAIGDMIAANQFAIGAYVLAIVVMQFMKKAEEILKKIFNFQASSMSSLTESAQTLAAARGNLVKVGVGAGAAFAGIKAAGGIKGLKESYANVKADIKSNRAAKKSVKETFKSGATGASSLKEYRNSEEGKAEFQAIKEKKLTDMKKEVDIKKEDRARKRYDRRNGKGAYDEMINKKTVENAKKYIEEQGEQELSNQKASGEFDTKCEERMKKRMGEEKYNQLKARAATQKNGKPTSDAKVAQKELDDAKKAESHLVEKSIKQDVSKKLRTSGKAKEEARTKAVEDSYKDKDTHSTYKRTINGVKDSKVGQFFNSREGKMVKAAMSDSTKVAAALAMGAVAFGASGELNDTILAGQFGFGFANGILENTSKTIANDAAEYMTKLLELTGKKPEELEDILRYIKHHSDAIPKMLKDVEKEFKSELKKVLGDENAQKYIDELQKMLQDEGRSVDIKKLLEETPIEDAKDREKIINLTKDYSEVSLQSTINSIGIKPAEAVKVDVDTLGVLMEKPVTRKMKVDVNINRNGTVTVDADDGTSTVTQTHRPPSRLTSPTNN